MDITTQTGLGVTVIGIVGRGELQLGTSQDGDVVACVGIPKSAPERPYYEGDPEITDPPTVKHLRQLEFVHEIIPVGSRGVRYEMGVLAGESGGRFIEVASPIDMQASAGASTCVLVTLPERHLGDLMDSVTQPVNRVGHLQIRSTASGEA